ncbi:MAG: hypothetical protein IPM16_16075 [Chloroflexi bacterium]|nr:hypothetical protein [Chloroflexota bacterium]
MTPEQYFAGEPVALRLFAEVCRAVDAIGDCELRVSKSQVAFRRRIAFAWAWCPTKVLKRAAAPLVLTIGLRRHDPSPRWKEVVEPRPGRFTHHIELYDEADVDGEVAAWLREAWGAAG